MKKIIKKRLTPDPVQTQIKKRWLQKTKMQNKKKKNPLGNWQAQILKSRGQNFDPSQLKNLSLEPCSKVTVRKYEKPKIK